MVLPAPFERRDKVEFNRFRYEAGLAPAVTYLALLWAGTAVLWVLVQGWVLTDPDPTTFLLSPGD